MIRNGDDLYPGPSVDYWLDGIIEDAQLLEHALNRAIDILVDKLGCPWNVFNAHEVETVCPCKDCPRVEEKQQDRNKELNCWKLWLKREVKS